MNLNVWELLSYPHSLFICFCGCGSVARGPWPVAQTWAASGRLSLLLAQEKVLLIRRKSSRLPWMFSR